MNKLLVPIHSREAMLNRALDVLRIKLHHQSVTSDMEKEKLAVEQRYAARLDKLGEEIALAEDQVFQYCTLHRAELFPDKKSLEAPSVTVGFELNPPKVEPRTKRITWSLVLARLKACAWGASYLRQPDEEVDKNRLKADRKILTPDQLAEAGIHIVEDEQFFIRPKSDIVEPTTTPT